MKGRTFLILLCIKDIVEIIDTEAKEIPKRNPSIPMATKINKNKSQRNEKKHLRSKEEFDGNDDQVYQSGEHSDIYIPNEEHSHDSGESHNAKDNGNQDNGYHSEETYSEEDDDNQDQGNHSGETHGDKDNNNQYHGYNSGETHSEKHNDNQDQGYNSGETHSEKDNDNQDHGYNSEETHSEKDNDNQDQGYHSGETHSEKDNDNQDHGYNSGETHSEKDNDNQDQGYHSGETHSGKDDANQDQDYHSGNPDSEKENVEKPQSDGQNINSKENNDQAVNVSDLDANKEDFPYAKDKDIKDRSLKTGDIFTPSELLPVTAKLMEKVENVNVGEGKGIVSSAKSPQELADRLFEAFFMTHKRIVILQEFDISGLDALQALALNGDVMELRNGLDSLTEGPPTIIKYRGQYVGVDKLRKQCHYKLMRKSIDVGHKTGIETKQKKGQRRDLAKRLAKKRRLVVNVGRSLNKKATAKKRIKPTRTNVKNIERQAVKNRAPLMKKSAKIPKGVINIKDKRYNNNKQMKNKSFKREKETSNAQKSKCRWRYECKDLADLDTCRLHTQCLKDEDSKATKKIMVAGKPEEERSVLLQRFRKMLGISSVDEEVEKILESRVVHLRPENMNTIERLESLAEYFNRIVNAEQMQKSTTPSMLSGVKTVAPLEKVIKTNESGSPKKSQQFLHEGQGGAKQNGWRILGIPTLPTAKPTTTPIKNNKQMN